MIELYKYVFCRYMRYYYRVDGHKNTAIFFGINLMSVTNWCAIFSISMYVLNTEFLLKYTTDELRNKIIIIIFLASLALLNWVYLIKICMLDKEYYRLIEDFEIKHRRHDILFYGYFIGIFLFFILSMILSKYIKEY